MSAATRGAKPTRIPLWRVLGGIFLSVAALVLGGLSAQPIYESAHVWLVVGIGGAATAAMVWAGRWWRWGALTIVVLIVSFLVLLPTVAVPSSLSSGGTGLVQGLGDGIAAVALGWKQLLTLTLPVGSYQTVLVPLLVITMLSVSLIMALTLRGGRTAVWAAIPMLAPILFGTIFGSSNVSEALKLGPLTVVAPREVALWVCAFGVAAAWVSWAAGVKRRAALKLGRATTKDAEGSGSIRRNTVMRSLLGVATVIVALVAGTAFTPLLDGGERTVPRDRIDPEIVVRELTSPLAGYRAWKRDVAFTDPIYTVSGDGELPTRLRTAVLEGYDGVDFFPGTPASPGRFTRFPSGEQLQASTRVSVEIAAGYSEVWVPVSMPLGEPPRFTGPRAAALNDSFYVNREADSAVVVPTAQGLREGDGYRAVMSTAADAAVGSAPLQESPLIDLETMPQLTRWLDLQQLPSTGAGLTEAIERLRDRGYLSHSLTDDEGERLWIEALRKEYGTRFVTSAGGHSIARIEQLFTQLSDQQTLAGENPDDDMLVAGIGDDEQFATAAALIARSMGFDSRVVMGVRLGDGGGNGDGADSDGIEAGVPGVPACTEVCTGEHVAAWIEVRGADDVWAPLDVTPQVEMVPSMLEEGEQLPEHPTLPEEHDATESDPPVGSADSGENSADPPEPDALSMLWPILRVVGLSLATLALIALAFLFIPVVKRVRTKRRRSGASAESRVLGAWQELIDAYADHGTRATQAESRRNIAAELRIPGGDWIASIVDRAVYSREGIDDDAAKQLWHVVDEQIADLAGSRGAWARIRARYSLTSFGVPHRRRSGRRTGRQSGIRQLAVRRRLPGGRTT